MREDMLSECELESCGFAALGSGVAISSRAAIYGAGNISIGDNVRIDDFTVISATAPIKIGSHVHIATHCFLLGKDELIMQDFSGISCGCRLLTASDDFSGNALTNPTIPDEYLNVTQGRIILERHVIIGANSVVLPHSQLMEGAAVGACSMVKGKLEPWGIYAGVPVQFVKPRSKRLLQLEKKLCAGAV